MRRKVGWLLGFCFLAVAAWFLLTWTPGGSTDGQAVGYSPLYDNRVAESLVPLTSQVAVAGYQQSMAAPCDTRDCEETYCCNETFCCEETWDCEPTWDCETTEAPTCETCEDARTCNDWRTCVQYPTCVGKTCDDKTCDGKTCDGVTCDGAECDEPTLDGGICDWTFDGPFCEGPTIEYAKTCDIYFCDCPTYEGMTCIRPTCDGPTCYGRTCFGRTCFLAECEVWDFGDAPEGPGFAQNLRTLLEKDGARHLIDGVYYLGQAEDAEEDGQPHRMTLGDDAPLMELRDDEDGVWFATTLAPGQPAVVIVSSSRDSHLNAWIDYDRSGSWLGDHDRIFDEPFDLQTGYNWIWFTVPEDIDPAQLTYARFRMSGPNNYRGPANRGEVEDYRVSICDEFNAWILTDELAYDVGQPIQVTYFVSGVSQVTLIRHRRDGQTEVIFSSTVEPGRHEVPAYLESVIADDPGAVETLEIVVTGLESACTAWLTTPVVTRAL